MTEQKLDVAKLGVAYRRLVLWFGVQLLFTLLGAVVLQMVGETTLALLIGLTRLLGILVTVFALALYAYRTAAALGSRVSVLWAVALLVPYVNVISLLVLSSKATKACRDAGIEVGFLGPKLEATTPAKDDASG